MNSITENLKNTENNDYIMGVVNGDDKIEQKLAKRYEETSENLKAENDEGAYQKSNNVVVSGSNSNEVGMHRKYLQTIDGVEIASSYTEFIELAIDDIKDRLKKHNLKLAHFEESVKNRSELSDQIQAEIYRRTAMLNELNESKKLIGSRLTRNNEMKSALINLASIIGYKLGNKKLTATMMTTDSVEVNEASSPSPGAGEASQPVALSTDKRDVDSEKLINELQTNEANAILAQSLTNNGNNNNNNNINRNVTYTRYIEMAYDEVISLLASDKQTLVMIIRSIKDNVEKLKELRKLKAKVDTSLKKLKFHENKLRSLIDYESKIDYILDELKNLIQNHQINNSNSQSPVSLVTPSNNIKIDENKNSE